jgi:hypothetical protein
MSFSFGKMILQKFYKQRSVSFLVSKVLLCFCKNDTVKVSYPHEEL